MGWSQFAAQVRMIVHPAGMRPGGDLSDFRSTTGAFANDMLPAKRLQFEDLLSTLQKQEPEILWYPNSGTDLTLLDNPTLGKHKPSTKLLLWMNDFFMHDFPTSNQSGRISRAPLGLAEKYKEGDWFWPAGTSGNEERMVPIRCRGVENPYIVDPESRLDLYLPMPGKNFGAPVVAFTVRVPDTLNSRGEELLVFFSACETMLFNEILTAYELPLTHMAWVGAGGCDIADIDKMISRMPQLKYVLKDFAEFDHEDEWALPSGIRFRRSVNWAVRQHSAAERGWIRERV